MIPSGALAAVLVAISSAVHAQSWTADLYAGGTRYQALADRVSATNLIANLRYEGARGSGYLSVAAPLDTDAAIWAATGNTTRLIRTATRPWNYGVEVGIHGYAFRDPLTHDLGAGTSVHALPLLALAHAVGSFELRGGWHEHVFHADSTRARGLFEAGARATAATGPYAAQLDARWLRAAEAAYPYAGVQVAVTPSFMQFWGWTGRWFGSEQPGTVWGVGGSMSVGRLGEVWVSVRQDAMDPLFRNTPRRGWNIGFSRPLGGARKASPELAPRLQRGAVQIRLPVSLLPGSNGGVPSVAGEFNNWRPAPMRQEGRLFVLDLPLGPGVYRFAFVNAAGEWFVPEEYPGRMEDGMGGYVALIVVP